MSETKKPLKFRWLHENGLNIRNHLIVSAVIRLILIHYGQIQDTRSAVPYTDIDYKVVTDGARLVLDGKTPFDRHTYRYSPILAYIQIPNVSFHPAFGKLVYGIFDLLLGMLIYALVKLELKMKGVRGKSIQEANKWACLSACFWLYNPLTAVISTRGNGDSLTGFLVILSIYLLLKTQQSRYFSMIAFCAGLVHGFVIHLRLYPLVFSLAYYLVLSDKNRGLIQYILPNRQQIGLVLGTIIGLVSFTWSFYELYGWKYIYEAYLYHLIRKDVRHNFSFQFLLQYLQNTVDSPQSTPFLKVLLLAPQLILITYLSVCFGRFRRTLPLCIFSLSFIIVTYNSVVTSQYFIWYLAVLPLCIKNFRRLTIVRCASLLLLWLCGQALWLLPAYLLEFKTMNTFYWIGLQSSIFFAINTFILSQLINIYEI